MDFSMSKLGTDIKTKNNGNGTMYSKELSQIPEEYHDAIVEAKSIFLLLPKNIHTSRAERVQWLLNHLNLVFTLPPSENVKNNTEIEILSIVPKEQTTATKFLLTNKTDVKFLSHSYRFVYCLDMSPSQSTIDVDKARVLFDEVLISFKNSIQNVVKEFIIPGTSVKFQPTIYLTVIVNTPFFFSPAQQVIIQGAKVTQNTIAEIVNFVSDHFTLIEGKIADIAALSHDKIFPTKDEYARDAYDVDFNVNEVSMASPDTNFVNMLRYSMLAVSLLPRHSISHIIVITDGVVAIPGAFIMESILSQLHSNSVAVSFMKVGSLFHPRSSSCYVSYTDLLYFFAHSTQGTCLEIVPSIKHQILSVNIYQEIFLFWSFYFSNKCHALDSKWNSQVDVFRKNTHLLSKHQTEDKCSSSLLVLLTRRMREGYMVDNISFSNGMIELGMCMEWRPSIYIYYKLSSPWPLTKNYATSFKIDIAAPYEFLHDITCLIKKDAKSCHRQATTEKFWFRVSQLSVEVGFAQQISSFPASPVWYNLPESIRGGIPVFTLNSLPSNDRGYKTNLIPNDLSFPKFIHLWEPICQMDAYNWRKWFHTHKISLILRHDQQLPKHCHLSSNALHKYQVIQCRQSATALYGLLAEWASFVLVDNNTYLKLIYSEIDKPPAWFCIVRVISKLPCLILHIGFITNTPGKIQNDVMEQLKTDISSLTFTPAAMKYKESACCVLFSQPLEKILIRYERMPTDFSNIMFSDNAQPSQASGTLSLTNSSFTTLSRYLYHKRWIWSASYSGNAKLSDTALSWILSTLTKMRLEEGFHFAYSSSGIITMVLELWMEPLASCIVQYILFPPTYKENNWYDSTSCSDDENISETEAELQLITEVWIEPQYGKVNSTNSRISYLNNQDYYNVTNKIGEKDQKCINSILTMEHLSLMCQEDSRTFNLESSLNISNVTSSSQKYGHKNSRSSLLDFSSSDIGLRWQPIKVSKIQFIPFNFHPISILPLCQQTELLFSLFVETKGRNAYIQKCEINNANKLLIDNIHDCFEILHDYELDLTEEYSKQFTKHVLERHKNREFCPLNENFLKVPGLINSYGRSLWRCLLKNISVTHVVLTFMPASLEDLKALINSECSCSSYTDIQCNNCKNNDDNTAKSLTLPIYVYNCPLSALVNIYTKDLDQDFNFLYGNDSYEDHRFVGDNFIRMREDTLQTSPDVKNTEQENIDQKAIAKQHCHALYLSYSKSFVMSLFVSLHFGAQLHKSDVQSAMDLCEESITEIDVTNYLLTVCGHVKHLKEDNFEVNSLRQVMPCFDLKPLHALIKEKFMKIINMFFNPILTNTEFYYWKNIANFRNSKRTDSDDEESNSDYPDYNSGNMRKCDESYDKKNIYQRMESGFSGMSDVLMSDIHPLFLQLICSVRYNNGEVSCSSIRVLPTCLGELIENLENCNPNLDRSKLKITLDIFCLTLPIKVQNVLANYSARGMRNTSFCSDVLQLSVGSPVSENSFVEPGELEPLSNLPELQKKAIIKLREEINWLLKDEIATALLDSEQINLDILNKVVNHITNSKDKSSCDLYKIHLNFVHDNVESYNIFVEEFLKLSLPPYKLFKEGDFYYLVKESTTQKKNNSSNESAYTSRFVTRKYEDYYIPELFKMPVEKEDIKDDISSQQSDVSSINGSFLTDGGYDEDISDDNDDYEWLVTLDSKRTLLPNFWLILNVDHEVCIYFHCRFLELHTPKVGVYLEIQRSIRDAIKDLCKKVNQYMLLKALYETKICDSLLEPEDENHPEINKLRTIPRPRLRKMSENVNTEQNTVVEETFCEFKEGEFSCPVVWQTSFSLHPRLKMGPGKPVISRGVSALKNILEKFSVSNRSNMFVYKDQRLNVFYLRLEENVSMCGQFSTFRSNEYENALVTRSPSITSLPLGKKTHISQLDSSLNGINTEIRPRVRSFGEKETKPMTNEDCLILKVHGITEAGPDVRCDLIQVLQNRLDDAVLEFLCLMLTRNSECPLTPEDVHFIQKPFKPPDNRIRLSVEQLALKWPESFTYYLKQNMQQFLNIPRYADNRSHYRFKDYCENSSSDTISEDNMFIYNQNQNQSGNRGIVCLSLNLVNHLDENFSLDLSLQEFNCNTFKKIISSDVIKASDDLPEVYLEFCLWKQGRINWDNLTEKLKGAVCQSQWDLVMEYILLKEPFCQNILTENTLNPLIPLKELDQDLSKEIEFNVVFTDKNKNKINNDIVISNKEKCEININAIIKHRSRAFLSPKRKTSRCITFDDANNDAIGGNLKKNINKPSFKLNSLENGSEGILSDTYSKNLPDWLNFGSQLGAPAVKKHKLLLHNRHLAFITVIELLNLIQDSPKAFQAIPITPLKSNHEFSYTLYNNSTSVQKSLILARNFEHWKAMVSYEENPDFLLLVDTRMFKHNQKFIPHILNNVLIPRQKFLWVFVESDSILIYAYNWTKEKFDKLIANCGNLSQWLSVRSCFLQSVTAQKLGIFQNQALTRKSFLNCNNSFTCCIGSVEHIRELTIPKESQRRSSQKTNIARIIDMFRDTFFNIKKCTSIIDTVVILTLEIQEIKLNEEKWNEEMKKLHSMYQSRTSSIAVPQIFLLLQNSRIIHYCHTPLLFQPKWRLQAAATRDHNIYPTQAIQSFDKLPTNPESWHDKLCYGFFAEYRRYLQTLGFMPLQFDNNKIPGLWFKDNSSYKSVFYIQKTILGGILLFTAEFVEPFFATKLHAIECNRLQNISSRASINRFTLCFLDECDRVKILMHLHSFAYDYHLRCVYNYILNNPGPNKLCDDYNLSNFLDDFLKYYNKGPNFARNLVFTDNIVLKNLITEGKQLYKYLLDNVEEFNFKTIKMEKGIDEVEYALVQVTSLSQVSYKDAQDRQHSYDFDLILIVHSLTNSTNANENILLLKYSIVLISKSDIYPASEVEQTLGKFRPVSSISKAVTKENIEVENKITDEITSSIEIKKELSISIGSDSHTEDNVYVYSEIITEDVNYLGYYSTHEQFMQQLISDKAKAVEKTFTEIVLKAMVDCRMNLLWNKLTSQGNTMQYNEFIELKNLAKSDLLCDIYPNLGPLLNQPLSWFEDLSKLLVVKYNEHYSVFTSPDLNLQDYVIFHRTYTGAFVLLSIDCHMSRGDLYMMYRDHRKQEDTETCMAYQKELLNGFVNCIVFFLWSGMI